MNPTERTYLDDGSHELDGPRRPPRRPLELSASRGTSHNEDHLESAAPISRTSGSSTLYDVLYRIAEYILEFGFPQQYCFEWEALQGEDNTSVARSDLMNMCLVCRSWKWPAQRVLWRRLSYSFQEANTLIPNTELGGYTRSLRLTLNPGRSIQPLTRLVESTTGLRLLSIDLKQKKEDIFVTEMSNLITAIGELERLEGLLVFNISAPIARVFPKPLFLGIRGLSELRYIGLGFCLVGQLDGPPIGRFTKVELAEYHVPPKLNTAAFWTDQTSFPGCFLDHLEDFGYRSHSGPDVFELKRPSPHESGISLLVTVFAELLKARRFFIVNMRKGQALSPSIEELFVEFAGQADQPGERICELISSGKLPNLRSVKVSSKFREDSGAFERLRALCKSRGYAFEAFIRFMDMRYIDELLFHARSSEI